MTNTTAGTIIRSQHVRTAYALHGTVAALTMARVIHTADAVWSTSRAEEQAGSGYSEEAYREAQDARIAAEEAYQEAMRLAEANL